MLVPTPDPLNFGETWIGQVELGSIEWKNNGPANVVVTRYVFFRPVKEITQLTPNPGAGGLLIVPGGGTGPVQFGFAPTSEGIFRTECEPIAAPTFVIPAGLVGKAKARQEVGNISLGPGGYVPPIGPFGTNEPLDFGDLPIDGHAYRTVFVQNIGPNPEVIKVDFRPGASGYFSVSLTGGGPPLGNFDIDGNSGIYVVIVFSPLKTGQFSDVVFFSERLGRNFAGIVLTGRGHDQIG